MLRFALTIFLGAFLLFGVQPLVGKAILPWFGGAPAVWNTCMLFFQALLLGGYAYAHWLLSRSPKRAALIHLTLLAASVALLGALSFVWPTPITASAAWKPPDAGRPVLRILTLLGVSIGLPYLLLASTGPLLQGWFSRNHPGRSPYRLYSLSNVGSLLALLSYPFIVEPRLGIAQQGWIWSGGFLLFAAGAAVCAWRARDAAPAPPAEDADEGVPEPPPGRGRLLSWFSLAACGSVLLLATTNQLCQEVAVVPLLWIVPLALYLVTFIICFDNERWYSRRIWIPGMVLSLALVVGLMGDNEFDNILGEIGILCLTMFVCCMVCHGELVLTKPAPRHLSTFYLMVSAGGAAGGVLVGIAAPLILPAYFEYHIALLGCAWLIGVVRWSDSESGFWRGEPRMAYGTIALALLGPAYLLAPKIGYRLAMRWGEDWEMYYYGGLLAAALFVMFAIQRQRRSALLSPYRLWWTRVFAVSGLVLLMWTLGGQARQFLARAPYIERNFYGVVRVKAIVVGDEDRPANLLLHGRTKHGLQYTEASRRRMPTTYYGPGSGAGLGIGEHPRRRAGEPVRVGAVGLGVGTVAALINTGDSVRFYEINPLVYDLSRGAGRRFTYLDDCPGSVDVVMGDARVSLERELASGQPGRFDVLVIDAFSSDSIPVHLITLESTRLYLQHLRDDDGVIAYHISNRYLDLEPVVRGIAAALALNVEVVKESVDTSIGVYYSRWLLLRRQTDDRLPSSHTGETVLWTDDYSNVWRVVRRSDD